MNYEHIVLYKRTEVLYETVKITDSCICDFPAF